MFFPRLKKEKNILVFDIGSSSVNASLLLKKENEIPVFLSFSHLRLPLLENPDFTHIERHARKAVKEIAEDVGKKNRKKMPDLIYMVLSAPWYFSETKNVKIQRRETFEVTEELVNKIMEDELELFNRKAREKFEDSSDIEILEKEKMRFIVNGYPIENPYGKETNRLELSIYLSAARRSFVKNIAWGANLVIRRVASSLNIGLGEALSFFTAQSWGDIKEATDKKLSSSSLGVCSEWQTFLGESLSLLGREHPLPQTLVVLGGVAGSDILKKCLNS